jgi:copper(I)-binding protein
MRRPLRSAVLLVASAMLLPLAVGTACSSPTPTRASSPNSVAGAKGLVAVLSPTVTIGSVGSGEIDAIITNAGTSDDVLIAVSVPGSLASGVSVERTSVPTGGLVVLSPSGPHVTLTGAKGASAGSTVSVTFTFEKVGDIVVNATVK